MKRSSQGRACSADFTCTILPCMSLLFKAAIAAFASLAEPIVTKPKPLDLPVSLFTHPEFSWELDSRRLWMEREETDGKE